MTRSKKDVIIVPTFKKQTIAKRSSSFISKEQRMKIIWLLGLLLTVDGGHGSYTGEARKVLRQLLMKQAAAAKQQLPVTVTSSFCLRSAGSRHDFYSEGDYWWPNLVSADSPYIQRDGMTNPDNFVAHRLAMVRFSRLTASLASAYIITGDESYVADAIPHYRAWFTDTASMMNPNLQYAQAIRGRYTGRSIGIIDGIQLMEAIQAFMVMEKAKCMDKSLITGVHHWVEQLLEWLTTHSYGIAEMNAQNNHGTCWVVQVSVFARFTGNQKWMQFCRDRYKHVLLPAQMATDGSFPLELKRTKPYGYSIFNLDAMATICQVLSVPDDNLWEYKTADGRSIRKGIDYLYPFVANKKSWPLKPDIMFWNEWPIAQTFLIFGADAFERKEWFDTWRQLNHAPAADEVLRNWPVRNPLIWMN